MSDLRTGLVEAIAQAVFGVRSGNKWGNVNDYTRAGYREAAAAALDAMLGFLTDNAEGWHDEAEGWHDEHGQLPDIFDLIAALSDSRDTGEKP